MNYNRFLTAFAVVLVQSGAGLAQGFTCSLGQPACLGYGETICSSRGKCVDERASCFDSYQCDYEGFACKSSVTECVRDYNDLLATHNKLVDDYNELLETGRTLARSLDEANEDLRRMRLCLARAVSLADAESCG